MTNEERPKGWLKRYTDRVLTGPQNSPEEIADSNAIRKALAGSAREWAQMQDDLSIAQSLIEWMPDGSKGHGASVSAPGDPDYEELCKLHNLQKPGDASTIFKRLIDGVWVVVDDLE
ncbi:hypothetical protein BH11CYA1_BH11CYA1_45780 [soil metagenome]